MVSCCAPVMPLRSMPRRSLTSISCMRFSERLKPIARRSSSASPPVKPAAIMAMQQLLLKQRYAQRAAQHRLEAGMQAIRRLSSLAAAQIRVHHFADDGAGTNQRHLHHHVVEFFWTHARKAGHLGAALHL